MWIILTIRKIEDNLGPQKSYSLFLELLYIASFQSDLWFLFQKACEIADCFFSILAVFTNLRYMCYAASVVDLIRKLQLPFIFCSCRNCLMFFSVGLFSGLFLVCWSVASLSKDLKTMGLFVVVTLFPCCLFVFPILSTGNRSVWQNCSCECMCCFQGLLSNIWYRLEVCCSKWELAWASRACVS